jgi:hypothetical protein
VTCFLAGVKGFLLIPGFSLYESVGQENMETGPEPFTNPSQQPPRWSQPGTWRGVRGREAEVAPPDRVRERHEIIAVDLEIPARAVAAEDRGCQFVPVLAAFDSLDDPLIVIPERPGAVTHIERIAPAIPAEEFLLSAGVATVGLSHDGNVARGFRARLLREARGLQRVRPARHA